METVTRIKGHLFRIIILLLSVVILFISVSLIASAQTYDVNFGSISAPAIGSPEFKPEANDFVDGYPELCPQGLILGGFYIPYFLNGNLWIVNGMNDMGTIKFKSPVSRVGIWFRGDGGIFTAYSKQNSVNQITSVGSSQEQYIELTGKDIDKVTIYRIENQPDEIQMLGVYRMTYDISPINTPEFPSVVIPIAAILGLITIFGRRKT